MGTRVTKGMRCFTVEQRKRMRKELIEKYGTNCQICFKNGQRPEVVAIDMSTTTDRHSFSIDHIVALADGGSNTLDNMWPTHVICNERKGSVTGGNRGQRKRSRKPVTQNTGPRLAYTSSSY